MTTAIVEVHPQSKTPAAEVEQALQMLAINSGRVRKTAEELGLHPSTISRWRQKHQDHYDTLVERVVPKIQRRIAERNEAIAAHAAEVEMELLDATRASVKDLKPNEVAGALRNVTITKAVNQEKALLYRGQPAREERARNVNQLLKGLQNRFGMVIESVATEVPDHPVRLASDAQETENTRELTTPPASD